MHRHFHKPYLPSTCTEMKTVLTLVIFGFVCSTVSASLIRLKRQDEKRLQENNCSMVERVKSCPHGYCCAYDEFFRIDRYCRKFGKLGDSCTTVVKDDTCECEAGLFCRPTVNGGTFVTIFGTCQMADVTNAATTKEELTTVDMPTEAPGHTIVVPSRHIKRSEAPVAAVVG